MREQTAQDVRTDHGKAQDRNAPQDVAHADKNLPLAGLIG